MAPFNQNHKNMRGRSVEVSTLTFEIWVCLQFSTPSKPSKTTENLSGNPLAFSLFSAKTVLHWQHPRHKIWPQQSANAKVIVVRSISKVTLFCFTTCNFALLWHRHKSCLPAIEKKMLLIVVFEYEYLMKVSVHKLQRLPSLKRAGNSLRRLKWPSFANMKFAFCAKFLVWALWWVTLSRLQTHTQDTPASQSRAISLPSHVKTLLIEPIWAASFPSTEGLPGSSHATPSRSFRVAHCPRIACSLGWDEWTMNGTNFTNL